MVDRNTKPSRLAEQERERALLAAHQKERLRRKAHADRQALENKDGLSREILAKVRVLPEYQAAESVMFYVHFRDEVRTRTDLQEVLESEQKVVVPYCLTDELGLFLLESWDELDRGMLGIPEPKPELREIGAKRVDISDVDLVIVPGVAFDHRGGRLGHGQGYYDKLLVQARPDTTLVAVAFECQLLAEVPMEKHDVYMDKIVTEKGIYLGRRVPR